MGLVLDLYKKAYAEQEAVYQEKVRCHKGSLQQYQHVQSFYEKEFQELGNERATLASRASAIEAVHSVREQERQAQLKAMSAITETMFEEKYTDTFAKL